MAIAKKNERYELCLAGVRRLAIFRALQLGDLLCTVPALRTLRHALPQAHITWVGLPWTTEFVARYDGYIDDFLEFPGYPGLPEREPSLTSFPDFVKAAQRRSFDLILQLHGSGLLTNPLVTLLGARHCAGYYVPGQYCPDAQRYLPYPQEAHEVHKHLQLCQFLGAEPQGEALEFPLKSEDAEALAKLEEARHLRRGNYICIHPGARYRTRRWPAERFAAVGDRLAEQGFDVVLTGSASERTLTAAVQSLMRANATDMAGRTTLGSLAALVSGARLVITNDTGMSHVAAALRVPSIVVVLSSDAERWAPLDRQRHRVVAAEIACRPCQYVDCPIGFPCAERISPDDVLSIAGNLLHGEGKPTRPREERSCVDCAC